MNIVKNRKNYHGRHILTNTFAAETDTWKSELNNNVLIFGPSGSGKTRHYVKPNLLTSHESMIISDTKGSLFREVGPALKERGYKVLNVNFMDLASGIGYNPFDHVRYDPETCHYNEQDILTMSRCLVTDLTQKDPYWDQAARQYLNTLIGYVLEMLPKERHTLESVVRMIPLTGTETFHILLDEMDAMKPGTTIPVRYEGCRSNEKAEKTNASIRGILSTHLEPLIFKDALALYSKEKRIDFRSLGREKTALFLTISDTDRSLDRLADVFFTQALQELCRSADEDYPDHMLPVPVRFYLDDFATNFCIPDFDKIISVIRSREISVSVILQSLTQLDSLYGRECARTIANNCDRQLYLGGQDPETAEYISTRVNLPVPGILSMPVSDAWLIERGRKPVLSQKFDLARLASLGEGSEKEPSSPDHSAFTELS